MKIIIPGGSGQVGTIMARAMVRDGHEVVVFSRSVSEQPWRVVPWDGENLGDWAAELEGAEVVINLAGRSVNCRYNEENKRQILDSRILSTRILADAIALAKSPPRVWLQAGTATIYSHRYDAPNDEYTGVIGGTEQDAPAAWGFSIEVATAWEETLEQAHTPQTRKVIMRSAVIMSPDHGGPFDILLRLVRFGLGGQSGNGRQFVSWIHEEDFVRAVYWLIEHEELSGPVNFAAPTPLPNVEFMRALRNAWGIPFGLPAPGWLLTIGAFFLQTETELVLKSRRVVPTRLLESGFTFQFPEWTDAATILCRQWRTGLCPK